MTRDRPQVTGAMESSRAERSSSWVAYSVLYLAIGAAMIMNAPPTYAILKVENSHYRVKIDVAAGLRFAEILDKETGASCLQGNVRSTIVGVVVEGLPLSQESFGFVKSSTTRRNGKDTLTIETRNDSEGLTGRLSLTSDATREAVLSFALTNVGKKARDMRVLFPCFHHLTAGGSLENTWYFFPYGSGWVSDRPFDLTVAYGQAGGSLQLVSLFDQAQGSGLYYWVKDNTGRMKTFHLRKMERAYRRVPESSSCGKEMQVHESFLTHDRGMNLITQSLPQRIGPGETMRLPDVVMGVGRIDWHEALDSYTRWVRSWWKSPHAPSWYRNSYGYVVSHDFAGGKGFETGFIEDSHRWVMAEKINTSTDHRIQLAYWHDHCDTDREGDTRSTKWYKHTIGDYLYEDSFGGLSALKEAIRKTQDKGVPVVLYVSCPTLTWKYGEAAKRFPDISIMDASGKPTAWWSADTPSDKTRYIDTCPQVEAWQDYLASSAARLVRDTGCLGIYLDTASNVPFCYNPKHQHDEYPSIAAEKYLRKIRAAVKAANPGCMVEAEDVCSDYLMQWIDGTWDKTFAGPWRPQDQTFDAYGVHFLRFYFPEISYAEWGSTWDNGAKRCFFNGIGYCRNNPDDSVDPSTGKTVTADEKMAWFARAAAIFRENGDAFTSLKPVPLIPTLQEGVYANEFPAEGKTVYTVFNKRGTEVSGGMLTVSASPDEHFVEFFSRREIPTKVSKGKVTLAFSLRSGEVLCIGKMKRRIRAEISDGRLTISVAGSYDPRKEKVLLCVSGEKGGSEVMVHRGKSTVVTDLPSQQSLAAKLVRNSFTMDMVILGKDRFLTVDQTRDSGLGGGSGTKRRSPAAKTRSSPDDRSFRDEFDQLDKDNWEISQPNFVSAKEGVLSMNTSNGDIRMTSFDLFQYGELRARIRYTRPPRAGRYYYLGFMERKDWGRNCCQVMLDGPSLLFQARKNKGEVMSVLAATLSPNQWYELQMVWLPGSLELLVDGKSRGHNEDSKFIPDSPIPLIIDVASDKAGEVGLDVDYIRVNRRRPLVTQ